MVRLLSEAGVNCFAAAQHVVRRGEQQLYEYLVARCYSIEEYAFDYHSLLGVKMLYETLLVRGTLS